MALTSISLYILIQIQVIMHLVEEMLLVVVNSKQVCMATPAFLNAHISISGLAWYIEVIVTLLWYRS